MKSSVETEGSMRNLLFDSPFLYKRSFLLYIFLNQFVKTLSIYKEISPLINFQTNHPTNPLIFKQSIILLLAVFPWWVQVNDHKSKRRNYSRPYAEEVWVGHEQESLKLVVFVWSDGHSLGQCHEVVARLLVNVFELVDSFLLGCLMINYKSTQNSALYSPFLASF